MLYYDGNLKNIARTLRKKLTDSEKLLWSRIRRKQLNGYQFYRQKILGRYIVDFYCPAAKLVIEVDGSQHYQEEGVQKDKIRDAYLAQLGLRVLRFASTEVFQNTDEIVGEIFTHLADMKSP